MACGAQWVQVGSNGQSIGSTVSDAIVSSWLWSTATRSCPLGYFSSNIGLLQYWATSVAHMQLHCKHQIIYGFSLSIFCAWLRLRFLYVETNTGPRRPVPAVCRILCSNVLGLANNLSDPTVASSQYDILLCSELNFLLRYASEILVPGFG